MTRGDFDETAARAALERARERHASAVDDAVRAYAARRETKALLEQAEEHYALMVAFQGDPPKVGDVIGAGVGEGYSDGVIVGIRLVRGNRDTPGRVTSAHLTIKTSRGTYVARRLVEPRKAQP